MKLFKILVLLAPVMCFVACSNDDNCTQDDWVGTYVGTQNGDGCFGSGSTTVTITASGNEAVVIIYEDANGSSTEYDPITPTECSISQNASGLGLTSEIEVLLDGNDLTITESLSDGTETSTCNVTATKQ